MLSRFLMSCALQLKSEFFPCILLFSMAQQLNRPFLFCLSRLLFFVFLTVSLQVATAIVKVALEEDLCRKIDPEDAVDDEWIRNFIARKMYFPSYVPLL